MKVKLVVLALCALFHGVVAQANMYVAMNDMPKYCSYIHPSDKAEQERMLREIQAKFLKEFLPIFKAVLPGEDLPNFQFVNEQLFDRMNRVLGDRLKKMRANVADAKKQLATKQDDRDDNSLPPVSEKCDFKEMDEEIASIKSRVFKNKEDVGYHLLDVMYDVRKHKEIYKLDVPPTPLEVWAEPLFKASKVLSDMDRYADYDKWNATLDAVGKHRKLAEKMLNEISRERQEKLLMEMLEAIPKYQARGDRDHVRKLCAAQAKLDNEYSLAYIKDFQKQYGSLSSLPNFGRVVSACNNVCQSIPAQFKAADIYTHSADIGLGLYSGHLLGIGEVEGHPFKDPEKVKEIQKEGWKQEQLCRGEGNEHRLLNEYIRNRAHSTNLKGTGINCYDNVPHWSNLNGCLTDYSKFEGRQAAAKRAADEAAVAANPAPEVPTGEVVFLGGASGTVAHD